MMSTAVDSFEAGLGAILEDIAEADKHVSFYCTNQPGSQRSRAAYFAKAALNNALSRVESMREAYPGLPWLYRVLNRTRLEEQREYLLVMLTRSWDKLGKVASPT